MLKYFFFSMLTILCLNTHAQKRLREFGLTPGVLTPGKQNSITDVTGVLVGHKTLIEGDHIRTGVTAVLPHNGNIYQEKVPAAVFVGNGFGKLAGSTQVNELGNIETPIILTNTLNVSTAVSAVINYTLQQKGNEEIQSVNALVGDTNDGWLNDIRGRHVQESDVFDAIRNAVDSVAEGNVGAGTGTVCFGFKGGIGTSSRKLPESLGGYTVGVLVQTNYGGVLQVDGVPVGKELKKFSFSNQLLNNVDGSCMIVVLRIPHQPVNPVVSVPTLHNDYTSQLFMAAIEATEEAVLNSLTMARTTKGYQGHQIEALPSEKLQELVKKYKAIPAADPREKKSGNKVKTTQK